MSRLNQPHNNFTFLLAGLLFLFALAPGLRLFALGQGEDDLLRVLLMAGFNLFTLISVWSLYRDRWYFKLGLGLALTNVAFFIFAMLLRSWILEVCVFSFVILFAGLSCYIAGRHVFSWRDTNANSLVGAVCVYLLVGLIFALVYSMFTFFWPQGSFQGLVYDGSSVQFDNFLYFSFVTLTTAGYGDITPLNPYLRTLAYFEMIVGQFYMAILVSGLVAHFMGLRMSR